VPDRARSIIPSQFADISRKFRRGTNALDDRLEVYSVHRSTVR